MGSVMERLRNPHIESSESGDFSQIMFVFSDRFLQLEVTLLKYFNYSCNIELTTPSR